MTQEHDEEFLVIYYVTILFWLFKENDAYWAVKEYLDNKIGLSEIGGAHLKKL